MSSGVGECQAIQRGYTAYRASVPQIQINHAANGSESSGDIELRSNRYGVYTVFRSGLRGVSGRLSNGCVMRSPIRCDVFPRSVAMNAMNVTVHTLISPMSISVVDCIGAVSATAVR